jgi:hypothetical protein
MVVHPVAAHVGDEIGHVWRGHLKGKVKGLGDARWAKQRHNHDSRYQRFGSNASLPPGKSLVGVIGGGGEGPITDTISFDGRLTFRPKVRLVAMDDSTPPPPCPGSSSQPRANPGFLCVYTGWSFGATNDNWNSFYDVEDGGGCGCRRGLLVSAIGDFAQFEITGVWVVTAPRAGG